MLAWVYALAPVCKQIKIKKQRDRGAGADTKVSRKSRLIYIELWIKGWVFML